MVHHNNQQVSFGPFSVGCRFGMCTLTVTAVVVAVTHTPPRPLLTFTKPLALRKPVMQLLMSTRHGL